jgi:protein-L-isoaspartate(D-aspartate) O-methyltransferase
MFYYISFFLLFIFFASDSAQDTFQQLREDMVKYQIEDRNVNHKATLNAMRNVPRHEFVPNNMKAYAYADRPLSIGNGQTISQPYIVAFMTSVIEPEPDDKVLEIGTGSGYQAAVLAEIVKEVYTIEIIPQLAENASKKFKELQYNNIYIRVGDGYHGWPDKSPFDAIIVTAAPKEIPEPLIDQLKEGGKLVIPVGPKYSVQYLQLVTKKNGKPKIRNLLPVRFVPFTRD